MNNLKPFDPQDIDETLTRVVTYGNDCHLLFPYINALGDAPKFDSVGQVIRGPSASVQDFTALSERIRQAGKAAVWFISFNTPWLVKQADADALRERTLGKHKR